MHVCIIFVSAAAFVNYRETMEAILGKWRGRRMGLKTTKDTDPVRIKNTWEQEQLASGPVKLTVLSTINI